MTTKPLKAFYVTDEDEHHEIVFERHAVTAQRHAADSASVDFTDIKCRRAAWADSFAGAKSIPAAEAILHGWHFECACCGSNIDEDYLDETHRNIANVIGPMHSLVFCDMNCMVVYNKHRAREHYIGQRGIDRFRRYILTKFPGVWFEESRDHHKPHAYVCRRRDKWHIGQLSVPFCFPGQVYGPAALRYDPDQSYRARADRKPHVIVCQGDIAAWQAFRNPAQAIQPYSAAAS